MLRLDRIQGMATSTELADRLHELDHAGRLETIFLDAQDIARRRLQATTDAGTACAIALPRDQRLANGAVLLLEADRAIVVRLKEEQWLTLRPRDEAAALELGYFAGNMHWPVRFDGATLRIRLHGPVEDHLDRLAPLIADGRVKRVDDDGPDSVPHGAAARR